MKKLVKWNKWIDYYGSVCFGLLVVLIAILLFRFIFYIDENILYLFNDIIGLLFKIYITCKLGILFWWMDLNLNKEEKEDGTV